MSADFGDRVAVALVAVDVTVEDGAVHVHVDARTGMRCTCPHCGKRCPGYDRRVCHWRHLDTCQLKTLLGARVPRHAVPPTWTAIAQTAAALAVTFAASRFFVIQLDVLGPQLGIRPHLVALLFSPITTELSETLNAVILVRQGKHRLALRNISGVKSTTN